VVEGQRQLGDWPGLNLALDDPRPGNDSPYTQDRNLGMIDDRGRPVDPENTVVVNREGSASELGGSEVSIPRMGRPIREGRREFLYGLLVRCVNDRNHQSAIRLSGEAEVHL